MFDQDNKDYQGRMESQLSELGKKIDELTDEAEHAAENVKHEYYENIDVLRSQKDDIQGKLGELKHSSGKAWEDIRNGMDRSWDEVQGTLKKAASRFQ